MGKIILMFALSFFVLAAPVGAYAASKEAGSSATINPVYLADSSVHIHYDKPSSALKKATIKKMLEKYHSPMVDSVDEFVAVSEKYDLNPYLLPSIAGLESSFGNAIMPGSYNAYGWGGGMIYFTNWDNGIDVVAKGLKENYIDKGLTSVEQIAPVYSASPTWAPRVENFIHQFEQEEQKNALFFSSNDVKL